MQLFYTTRTTQNDTITITEPRVVDQLRKVLRAQSGYQFAVQNDTYRLMVTLTELKTQAIATITQTITHNIQKNTKKNVTMAIAMPNKAPILELIIQKLTEIGVSTIVIRQAQRSQLKELSPNKKERLHKIMIEALEQSRWKQLPQLIWANDLNPHLPGKHIIVCDLPKDTDQDTDDTPNLITTQEENNPIVIIGPEGWLTTQDYTQRDQFPHTVVSLGDTVLRMETAAIVSAARQTLTPHL